VSISAIGFGDGLGVGVGRGVNVGATDAVGVAAATDGAAVGDALDVDTRPGTASHATNRIANSTAHALILLG
jgi:hypothetical protein